MHANLHDRDRSPDAHAGFDYSAAFSRNIGWVTEWEQQELRKKTVAIAGLGGVGGAHALTLARLGIGGLHLADLDRFDVVNLNRQAGAFISTVNLEKSEVMAHMTRDINPELRQTVFPHGIDDENLDAFLSGVDLFVDGLDFFVIDIRRKVFKRCAELGIPAITAAPIGFGSSYLIFMPGGMSFEDYFRLEGLSRERQYVNFAVGLTPKGFHRGYMVDPSRIDLAGKRGPSTAAAIQLCAGIVGAEAVKILLGRGKVHAAPAYHQFDAYRGRWSRGYLRFGNAGPLQSLKRRIGYQAFGLLSRNARPAEAAATGSDVEHILDFARWAPSGDNCQPWRFEILDDQVTIRVSRKEDDIYDYNGGQPTLLATGMLLETMRIAASRFGRAVEWSYGGCKGGIHSISVKLPHQTDIRQDPLFSYIALRSVDRRSYGSQPLTPEQKKELEQALGDGMRIKWHETRTERWRQSLLNAMSSDIRLRLPEAYPVHRRVIEWDQAYSRTGIPAGAIGADPMTIKLMRWVMQSWPRQRFFNRFLMGTAMPRIQLDLLPGLFCAAHFSLCRNESPTNADDEIMSLLRCGSSIQRFWLTATRLGLSVQPALSPVIFSHYGRAGGNALSDLGTMRSAKALARKLDAQGISSPADLLFRGRIGFSGRKASASRSIRRSLADLMGRGRLTE